MGLETGFEPRERGGKTNRHTLGHDGPNRFRKRAGEMLEDLVKGELAKRQGREYVLCDGEAQ